MEGAYSAEEYLPYDYDGLPRRSPPPQIKIPNLRPSPSPPPAFIMARSPSPTGETTRGRKIRPSQGDRLLMSQLSGGNDIEIAQRAAREPLESEVIMEEEIPKGIEITVRTAFPQQAAKEILESEEEDTPKGVEFDKKSPTEFEYDMRYTPFHSPFEKMDDSCPKTLTQSPPREVPEVGLLTSREGKEKAVIDRHITLPSINAAVIDRHMTLPSINAALSQLAENTTASVIETSVMTGEKRVRSSSANTLEVPSTDWTISGEFTYQQNDTGDMRENLSFKRAKHDLHNPKPLANLHASANTPGQGTVPGFRSSSTTLSSAPSHPVSPKILRDFTARVRSPTTYLNRLRDLEMEVFDGSTVQIYFPPTDRGFGQSNKSRLVAEFPVISNIKTNISDQAVLEFIGKQEFKVGKFLGGILECRNVLAKALNNIYRLRDAEFCGSNMSIICADNSRGNVVQLQPVYISDIETLFQRFEHCLSEALQSGISLRTSSVRNLLDSCIKALGMVLPISWNDVIERRFISILRLTVHLVDLTILSYSGAHVNDFGRYYASETCRVFDLLTPFSDELYEADGDAPGQLISGDWGNEDVLSIRVQRCHLQCLDAFHDYQPVWVFSSPIWTATGKLLLSTTLEPLADIWGPLWKAESPVKELHNDKAKGKEYTASGDTSTTTGELALRFPERKPNYLHYVVGNGRIVKWPESDVDQLVQNGEVFCHWTSNREGVDLESLDWPGNPPETLTFDGSEVMLIGAYTIGSNDLKINPRCGSSLTLARKHLIDQGRLHIHGAAEPYLYRESISYQLHVGYSGVNASAGIQYKKIPGRDLKGILVEQWAMFPEIRRPELLEDLYGLEVSICTKNSRRVQLSELLSRNCMRNLLQCFPWQRDDYRRDYFKALETNCFTKLDSDPVFKDIFGKAVLISLSFLKETGVNHENKLLVFLCSAAAPKPELAALSLKEHSWIGLLRDSPDSCTMAMFGDRCLEFTHATGTTCGKSGRSTLRTSLTLNTVLPPPPFLKIEILVQPNDCLAENDQLRWGSWWLACEENIRGRLWLGRHGTLDVLKKLDDETFLVDWRASPITLGLQKLMRKSAPSHREYLEIDRSPVKERVRPLPVFVLAELKSQDLYT